MIEPIYVSWTGGSGLSLLEFNTCQKRTFWKLQGWRPRLRPVYFIFGGLVHKYAFKPYLEPSIDFVKAGVEEVSEVCETKRVKEGEREVEIEITDKERKDLPRITEADLTVWGEKKYEPEVVHEVEFSMASPLFNPLTGKEEHADLFQLAGRLDLLVGEDNLKIVDLKTTSRPIEQGGVEFKRFGYWAQLSLYRYLMLKDEKIKATGIFQLTKHLRIDTVRKYACEITVEPISFVGLYKKIKTVMENLRVAIETNRWVQNINACEGLYGDVCPFQPLCWGEELKRKYGEVEVKRLKESTLEQIPEVYQKWVELRKEIDGKEVSNEQ